MQNLHRSFQLSCLIVVRFAGCLSDSEDVQREANKLLADYKFKLQKAEQDMSTLQATVARLESQVIRYKSAAEASEKAEDELKVEKRKLQREVRKLHAAVEPLPRYFEQDCSVLDDMLLLPAGEGDPRPR